MHLKRDFQMEVYWNYGSAHMIKCEHSHNFQMEVYWNYGSAHILSIINYGSAHMIKCEHSHVSHMGVLTWNYGSAHILSCEHSHNFSKLPFEIMGVLTYGSAHILSCEHSHNFQMEVYWNYGSAHMIKWQRISIALSSKVRLLPKIWKLKLWRHFKCV